MSMPSLPEPNPNLTKEQALNMILTSIALEETALSHIINAEGEKIQHVISNCSNNTDDILAVNNSVKEMLEVIMQNQMILKGKMEKVLSHLPTPCDEDCCDNCYCENKTCCDNLCCEHNHCNYNCNCDCGCFRCKNNECKGWINMSNLAQSHLYCMDP